MHATKALSIARLVHNHSTVAPGLKPVLKRLAARLPDGDTITPGRIAVTRWARENFTLAFGATGPAHGFKLIARKGKATQEVLITTKTPKDDMQKHIEWCIDKVHGTARSESSPNQSAVMAAMMRIEALDVKLGAGVGAQKERAKLQIVVGGREREPSRWANQDTSK